MINLKARFRNKTFLVALFSGIILLIQQMGLNIFPANVEVIFNSMLGVLVLLGVVIDPSSQGVLDESKK